MTYLTSDSGRVHHFDGPEPIAIVSMACRYPGGASSPSALWDMLIQNKSGRCEIPKDRFNLDAFYHPNENRPGSLHTRGGYFLTEDVGLFDPLFFGITPKEAAAMDPQQRKLLEVSYEAIEAAGITLEEISGTCTGCYVGNFSFDYLQMQTSDPEYLPPYQMTGGNVTILSNRISHIFNLKGPSFTLDTACSSSMYALHLGCRALSSGDCDGVLVGGTNLILHVDQQLESAKLGVLSPTDTCHTFDAAADGYARGEGVGVLYIKRLSDALRDGNPIRAIIRGTAATANGKTSGIIRPSAEAQAATIRAAYANAGNLDYKETGYVECHGTGTPTGDPIEIDAIGSVFAGTRTSEAPLLVGSIKTNLGHTEAASGIAGVMKAVLTVERGVIPAHLGFRNPNPQIDFAKAKVEVVTENTPMPAQNGIRRVSVNSFGYGGANAHAIVESFSPCQCNGVSHTSSTTENSRIHYMLPFSGHDTKSVKNNIAAAFEVTYQTRPIEDLAHTLSRRSQLSYKGFSIGKKGETYDASVAQINGGPSSYHSRICYVFAGQGSQYAGMGRELFRFPEFRSRLRSLDLILLRFNGENAWTIEETIKMETSPVDDPVRAQVSITALQIGLVDLLASWNVIPKYTVGHSSGEFAAAYTAGYLTAAQALAAAYYRGISVSEKCSRSGAMAAVGLSEENAIKVVHNWYPRVTVACVNSPNSVTISGDNDAIEEILEIIATSKTFARKLNTSGLAYHSTFVKASGAYYEDFLTTAFANTPADLDWSFVSPQRPRMVSSVTGTVLSEDTSLDSKYWRANLESRVLFSQALEEFKSTFSDSDHATVIEVSPHTTLASSIRSTLLPGLGSRFSLGSCLRRDVDAEKSILTLAGILFLQNFPVKLDIINFNCSLKAMDWDSLGKDLPRFLSDYATYRWNHDTRLWTEPRRSKEWRFRSHARHDLLGSRVPALADNEHIWRNILSPKHVPWLAHHVIGTDIVFPGCGYFALAVEAAYQTAENAVAGGALVGTPGGPKGFTLKDVNISQAMIFPKNDDEGVEIMVSMRQLSLSAYKEKTDWFEFTVSSSLGETWTENCRGRVRVEYKSRAHRSPRDVDLGPLQQRFESERWYEQLRMTGLFPGEAFRQLQDLHVSGNSCTATATTSLDPGKVWLEGESRYPIHPISLDSSLLLAMVAAHAGSLRSMDRGYLPVLANEITVWNTERHSKKGFICASGDHNGLRAMKASAEIWNEYGELVAEIKSLLCVSFEGVEKSTLATRVPYLRLVWKPDIESVFGVHGKQIVSQRVKEHQIWRGDTVEVLLELATHKNPGMDILEVDCGNGNFIDDALLLMAGHGSMRSYRTYTLCDASIDMIEALKKRYLVADNLDFKTFDPRNPTDHPWPTSKKFDLIIARHLDLHETEALKIIRDILKPAGSVIVGNQASRRTNGLLNGYQDHIDADRDQVFLSADSPPVAMIRTLQKRESSKKTRKITLVNAVGPTELSNAIEAKLKDTLKEASQINLQDALENIDQSTSVIIMAEFECSVLEQMTKDQLKSIQHIVSTAKTVLWVTGGALYHGRHPERILMPALAKSIRTEQPSIRLVTLDFDPENVCAPEAAGVVNDLFWQMLQDTAINDNEYIYEAGSLMVSRVRPDARLCQRFEQDLYGKPRMQIIATDKPLCVDIENAGDLSSLYFREDTSVREGLKPEDIEISVKASGMNSKALMLLAGRYHGSMDELSTEVAGVVHSVGSKVSGIEVGDRVVAMVGGRFGTFQRAHHQLCQKLRDDETFEDMATVPVAYTTSVYSLLHVAKLQPGEIVLIHSAAGALGIACIQIAQMIGAEIIVTVSTEEKRELLHKQYNIPQDRIFSSRNASFVDEIMRVTDGTGADVIINSLVGSLMHETWRCLAPFGRFLEVGKKELINKGRLDMDVFERAAMFCHIDMNAEKLPGRGKYKSPVELISAMLKEVMGYLRDGVIKPIRPISTYSITNLEAATRAMAKGTHFGKLVITYDSKPKMIKTLKPSISNRLLPDSSYLLVGCLGGLGRSLVKLMLENGARNFVFLSRSGAASPSAAATVSEIHRTGGHATIVRGDVSIEADVLRAVKAAPRLAGVVQGAMVVEESLFSSLTTERFFNVVRPKVQGTWNLHRATLDHALDFFIMTSSLASLLGSPTESAYTAANAFLDNMARHRHSLGLPATSLSIGMVIGIGHVANHPSVEKVLSRNGIYGISELEFKHMVQEAMLRVQDTEPAWYSDSAAKTLILTGLEPHKLRELRSKGYDGHSYWGNDPRLISVVAATTDAASSHTHGTTGGQALAEPRLGELDEKLRSGAFEDALALYLDLLVEKFSRLLMMRKEEIVRSRPLAAYGMDSMIGSELRSWMYKSFSADISLLELLESNLTSVDLAKKTFEQLKQRSMEAERREGPEKGQ